MRTGIALSCLAVAAILTGCSSGSTTTRTAPAKAATAATPSTATTAAAPSTSTSSLSGPDGVPAYQPATVVSQWPGSLRIISDDSVTQVGAYYASTFSGEGWVLVSKTVSPGGASFTLHKNGQEVTVAVYPTPSGSGVLISSSGLSSRQSRSGLPAIRGPQRSANIDHTHLAAVGYAGQRVLRLNIQWRRLGDPLKDRDPSQCELHGQQERTGSDRHRPFEWRWLGGVD